MTVFRTSGYIVNIGAGGAASTPSSVEMPALTPQSFNSKLVVTGHSVPDNVIQWPWRGVILDKGGTPDMTTQTGPYAGAGYRWDNDPVSPDAVKALLGTGGAAYDLFMGTEAHGGGYTGWVDGDPSSVAAYIEYGDAFLYATQWHNLAAATGAQTFYSNFWRDDPTETFGATWRASQDLEVPLWDSIIDYVNANKAGGTPTMRLVPWLQVFMGVYDAIQAGTVTGITMASIFADNVHPASAVGRWLQMATMMAVIYQRHPDEMSHTWTLEFSATDSISSTLAAQLRPIVWTACLSNSRTGLTT